MKLLFITLCQYIYGYTFSFFHQFNLHVILHFEEKQQQQKQKPKNVLRGIAICQRACKTLRSNMIFVAGTLIFENAQFSSKGK